MAEIGALIHYFIWAKTALPRQVHPRLFGWRGEHSGPFARILRTLPWMQPRGKWMVSLVNFHADATSSRWHMREIDLRFALHSTPVWFISVKTALPRQVHPRPFGWRGWHPVDFKDLDVKAEAGVWHGLSCMYVPCSYIYMFHVCCT